MTSVADDVFPGTCDDESLRESSRSYVFGAVVDCHASSYCDHETSVPLESSLCPSWP